MDTLALIGTGIIFLAVTVWLAVLALRLRLEVWANQRVIAALEQAGHKPPAKKSRLPEMLAAALLLMLALQLLLLFAIPG
ncbi:MAG: hypothetical protein KF753_22620 [Caldilineaceae bacterium]|nr:hypothetical protein [Caldilineaceae bacterium]